jgi:uncharacterized protein (TIGR02246 family)
MKHLSILLLAVAALLPHSAAAAPAGPQDRAALQALAHAADAAWDKRDVDAMMKNYAADATLRLGGMDAPVQGLPKLRAFFTQGFAARTGELRHVTMIDHVELSGPDLALADGQVLIQRRGSDGSWSTIREFANMSVAVREGGQWKLSAVRGYPVEPKARQTASR